MLNLSISESIFDAVKKAYPEVDIKLEDIALEHPAVEEYGDYSTNIALKLKIDAKKIIENLPGATLAGPGFINFKLTSEQLVSHMAQALEEKDRYGSSNEGAGKTFIIDYSAPNIAKRFGIGHLRSTIIGQAIYNLYKFLGYTPVGDNHLGDWGTQFGKLLYMITTEKPEKLTIDKLEEMYVRFHRMAEEDKSLEDKGRQWFKKIEDGDTEARRIWQECWDISMAEFNRIYQLLNVKIDYTLGESFYEDKMPALVELAKKSGVVHESEGALVIDIPGDKAPLMLIKSDGGTTYSTRDLATLMYRGKKWDPEIIVYEVGVEQAYYFNQLFVAAKLLKLVRPETALIHTKHGLYCLPEGKFSTRKGNAPKLEEILNEAIKRAEVLGSAETAQAVGIGAIKYYDLSHGVQSDIIFSWENMFSLEGDSGPYIQYTYARARSIIRKSQIPISKSQFPISNFANEEMAILRYLYRFPEVVEAAAKNYSPNLVCSYLFELAKRFNNLYNNCPILENNFRLALTEAVSIVLKNGLTLLGIVALERM